MIPETKFNESDVSSFIKFVGHKEYWLQIFKPKIDGKDQRGDLKSLFTSDKRELVNEIKKDNGKGLICLAINERPKGKTKGIDVNQLNVLVFDVDVRKNLKQGYVSTEKHHNHAIKKAYDLKIELEKLGFDAGLVVDSGNGSQVYCKINVDLKENKEIVLNSSFITS